MKLIELGRLKRYDPAQRSEQYLAARAYEPILENFSFSYVWLSLENVTEDTFTSQMTEKIRVQGLEWDLTNGTYLTVQMEAGSPLVIFGEVYSDEWQYLDQFTVGKSLLIDENQTYNIIIWATLRTGQYDIVLSETAVTDTDPYYAPSASTFGVFAIIASLIFLAAVTRKKKK